MVATQVDSELHEIGRPQEALISFQWLGTQTILEVCVKVQVSLSGRLR